MELYSIVMIHGENSSLLINSQARKIKYNMKQTIHYIFFFILLNTTATLIINSILFYEIQMIYSDVTSKNITNTFDEIQNMLNNVCVIFPEVCQDL
jgi:hypothetical protein